MYVPMHAIKRKSLWWYLLSAQCIRARDCRLALLSSRLLFSRFWFRFIMKFGNFRPVGFRPYWFWKISFSVRVKISKSMVLIHNVSCSFPLSGMRRRPFCAFENIIRGHIEFHMAYFCFHKNYKQKKRSKFHLKNGSCPRSMTIRFHSNEIRTVLLWAPRHQRNQHVFSFRFGNFRKLNKNAFANWFFSSRICKFQDDMYLNIGSCWIQ